jgi:hypothetical protein
LPTPGTAGEAWCLVIRKDMVIAIRNNLNYVDVGVGVKYEEGKRGRLGET